MPIIPAANPSMTGTGRRRSLVFTDGGSLVPRGAQAPAAAAPVQPGAAPGAPAPATAAPLPTPGVPTAPPSNAANPANLGQQGAPPGLTRPPGSGIDPVDVNVGPSTLGSFQEHQDAAYQQATRTLDPMWEANRRQFDQTMINRGITPGSEAYDLALAQHDRSRTDAYAQAQDNALRQGQAAQQQAFQQNYMESELANQLLRQREGNQTSIDVAGIGAGASAYGVDQSRLNFLDQLGFNSQQAGIQNGQWDQQFGRAGDQWNRQFEQSGDQWDRQFGMGQQNSDFNQMMQMMGFDRDTTNMGNQQQNQQFSQLMSMFGLMPQAQGSSPVDYLGALGQNQNQQNQNYATGSQNANQQNANYAAIASYFLCDAALKDIGTPVDTARCLKIALDLPLVNFTYKADVSKQACVGTIAQDFNTALHGDAAPSGVPMIKILDMFGVLLGAVQELGKQVEELKARQGGVHKPIPMTGAFGLRYLDEQARRAKGAP